MSCPKRNKFCFQEMCFRAKTQQNYLCVGINSKPEKTPKDILKICMRGIYSNTEHEITIEESCYLIQALTTAITTLAVRRGFNGK